MPYRVLFYTIMALFLCGPIMATQGPFEKTGPNLVKGGDLEGSALVRYWTWNNNNGNFHIEKVKGRNGGKAAAFISSGTEGRGSARIGQILVPIGADVRVSLWVAAEGHSGGGWVNLEGRAATRGQEFFLAGGTYGWKRYEYRTSIKPGNLQDGMKAPLELWFYVYGQGTLLVDDIEVRTIEPDPLAEQNWARERIKAIADAAGSWKAEKSATLKSFVSKAMHSQAVSGLDNLIKAIGSAISGFESWGVLVTDPVRRVFRDIKFRGDFATSVDLDMARHEFEGKQLLLFAHSVELRDVSISITDLNGPGEFSAENIQVLPVAYGDRSQAPDIPWYRGPSSNDWPDPLLPNRHFTVERGTVQPVYLRFYCPPATKPGKYEGKVRVSTSAGQTTVPVNLTVHEVTMPVSLHVKTMHVGGRETKLYMDLALEQRMPLGTIFNGLGWKDENFRISQKGQSFDFTTVENRLQYCIDRGLNAFTVAQTYKSGTKGFPRNYSQAWKSKMSKVIREYGRWLKQKGWLHLAYFNNIDEPGKHRWDQVKELYRMSKLADPEIKVFSCVNTLGALSALDGYADVFDVYIQQYHLQQAAIKKAQGVEIWWAVCIWPSKHPNLFVEYPLMDARLIGWMTFKYAIDGFEYWNMTSWNRAWKKRGKKAPDDGSWITTPGGVLTTEWPFDRILSGDGYLCYPGPAGEPINSLRFEALRDGFEDYELLYQLRQKLPELSGDTRREAQKLLDGGDGLVTNTHLFSIDSVRLFTTRKRVLKLLTDGA